MGTTEQTGGPTHVVPLTPAGRGAVAVVLVAGPAALSLVDACFVAANGRSLDQQTSNEIVFGRWDSETGEEIVVTCRGVESTSGNCQIEIHCHGGEAAVGAIVQRLEQLGCVRMTWQEWTARAERDPIRRAAMLALAEAPTQRAAVILVDQLNGALAMAVREVLEAAENGRWLAAAEGIDGMLAFRSLGLHLVMPWRVVLAGEPNVGKSSLINALAGYERAIVCEQPGTTRDVVTLVTATSGWAIELADTAGLRESADDTEVAGIALTGAALAEADLVVWVRDTPGGGEARDPRLPISVRRVDVLNKIDLLSEDLPSSAAGAAVCTCALSGAGIAELWTEIERTLVPAAPESGAAVPFTLEQLDQLDRAKGAIDRQDSAAAVHALRALLAE